jgi:DNA-binding transcriptional MerR regulator
MEITDKPVSSKEVYVSLGIGDSTLRKWALALEANGYIFPRTDNNKRLFFEKDLVVLRHFRNLVQVQNFSIENAALIVTSKFNEEPVPEENSTNSVPALRDSNELIEKLMNHIEQQEVFNQQLLKRLDEQQKYIEERLNQRDSMLMDSLRQSQETKQLLLEVKEAQEKKPRKGFMHFFSKE